MQVLEIMTDDPSCCNPETPLPDVAKMMVECDCGCIPVVDSQDGGRCVGVITDRDIVCRTLAQGQDPMGLCARDAMSTQVMTASSDERLEDCIRTMEQNAIRRLLVVDENDRCIGIVSQADIALRTPEQQTAELVREVSQATGPSHLAA